MAHEGFVPFATTYAVFASRRAYDFISQAIAEENLNVKICCALPGLTTGYGPSHQATEDIAIFRGMPDLTIVDPCDALDIEQAVPRHRGARRPGLHAPAARQRAAGARRVRLQVRARQGEADPRRRRRAGHLLRLHDHARAGSRPSCWRRTASNVAVLHVPTIKPLDEATILREAGRSGRLVSWPRTTPSSAAWARRSPRLLLRAGRARRRSGRSRCRTSSSTPARCRRCTTATASRPRPWRGASRAGCSRPLPTKPRRRRE